MKLMLITRRKWQNLKPNYLHHKNHSSLRSRKLFNKKSIKLPNSNKKRLVIPEDLLENRLKSEETTEILKLVNLVQYLMSSILESKLLITMMPNYWIVLLVIQLLRNLLLLKKNSYQIWQKNKFSMKHSKKVKIWTN
jgi:hypothetical protein